MTVRNSAEGQVSSTGLTAGNSGAGSGTAFSVVSIGGSNTAVYSNTSPMHGLNGILVTKGGTAASVFELRENSGVGSTDFSIQVYYRMPSALPATAASLGVQLRTIADAAAGNFIILNTGPVRMLTSGGATIATGTVNLTTGVYYRFDFRGTGAGGASGAWNLEVYTADGLTQLDAISGSGITTPGLVDRARAGNSSGTATGNYEFDDFRLNVGSNTAMGPAGPEVSGGFVRHRVVLLPPRRPSEVAISPALMDPPDWFPIPARATRKTPAIARRRRPATPVPTQTAVIPARSPAQSRARRFGQVARRAEVAFPVPAQVTVSPPGRVASPGRGRRAAALARRGEQGFVIPAQIAPSVPAYPVVPVTARRIGRKQRRATVVSPPRIQAAVPPAFPPRTVRKRTLLLLVRGTGAQTLALGQAAQPSGALTGYATAGTGSTLYAGPGPGIENPAATAGAGTAPTATGG